MHKTLGIAQDLLLEVGQTLLRYSGYNLKQFQTGGWRIFWQITCYIIQGDRVQVLNGLRNNVGK